MLLLLCVMPDSDPDRRGRTSVCRRIMPFLDQRINAKFAKSISGICVCVFTDWAKTPSPYASLPVLAPDTALV